MSSNIRLGYIILYVKDVGATVSFYQEAFSIKERFTHESKQYAEMETGNTVLAFASEEFMNAAHVFRPNSRGGAPAGAEIAFVVEDIEKQFKIAIDAGAVELEKPVQKPWGQTVAHVRDNNGFLVELCTDVNL